MHGFTESKITLNFPDTNYFRFGDCEGHKYLSGNDFKEMDACWFDLANNTYWLIELKNFTEASLDTKENVESRTWNILKKSVDCLCMFLSAKHAYPYSAKLTPCFPFSPLDANTQFKFITVVHCSPAQAPDVQLIHNSFRRKFRPYAELFGIKHYAVIEHSSAIRNLPNNMVL